MNHAKKNILLLALLFFTGILLTYSNHWHNGFHFDDEHTIVENVHIRKLENIPEFFRNAEMFSSKPDHRSLRPLVTTSLAVDYWIGGGLYPFYFHLSTFIWFLVTCTLIFAIYRNLLARSLSQSWAPYLAIVGAGWYGLHPAMAETVNYIISRSDVLSTLFIVLSFFIYVVFPSKRKWYLYVIAAVMGVFAKETVLTLIPILFFYIALFEKDLTLPDLFNLKKFGAFWKIFVSLLPLIVVLALTQWYTFANTPESFTGLSNPFVPYILTQSYVWLHYFSTFFLPLGLSADTDMAVILNPFDYRILVGLAFVGLLVFTIFKTSVKKETKPIAFGLLWFSFSLLPTSLAPLAEVLNDHRMFFPFIGLALAAVSAVGLGVRKWRTTGTGSNPKFAFAWTVVFVVLAAYAYGTHTRNKVWKNEETLWYDVTVKSPNNGRGLMNYGLTQMAKGNYAGAAAYYEKALSLTPDYYILNINMGILKSATGKPGEAEIYFKKAISNAPVLFEPYYYYARFLRANNRLNEAKTMAEKAVSISPYFADARYLLLEVYNELELWEALAKTAQETLAFSAGDSTARAFLEASKKKASKIDGAIAVASTNPTPENYLNLSLQFFNSGLYEKCIDACREALKLKPDYAAAYNNMCAAYNNLGQWNKAIEACNQALKLDPQNRLATSNLAWSKNKKK